MKVKVIKANSLEEVLAMIAHMTCANCECPSRESQKSKVEKPVTLDYFIEELAKKKGWRPERMAGWLNGIAELSPIAALNILLREIAVYLNQKYEDHIENSDKIYIVSTLDGRVHEVCKKYIKNYRNFAAFRTIEDAKFACNLLRDQLKGMFKKNAERK